MNSGEDTRGKTSPLNSMAKTCEPLSLHQSFLPSSNHSQFKSSQANESDLANSKPRLIKYPSNDIIKIIEKGSTWNSSSSTHYIHTPSALSSQPNVKLKKSRLREKKERYKPSENELNLSTKCLSINQANCVNEAIPNEYNEKYLEQAHLKTNLDDEDKVLMPLVFSPSLSSVTQSSAQANSNTDLIIFTQQREISNLRGQVESLNMMIDKMSQERSSLQIQINDLKVKISNECGDYYEVIEEKKKLQIDNFELEEKIAKWESVVDQYQEMIETKTQEMNETLKELKTIGAENSNLKLTIEPLKAKITDKDLLIDSLKAEILSKCEEIEQLKGINLRSIEKIDSLNSEILIRCKQRDLYQNECSKVMTKLNEMKQKLIDEQNEKINLKTHSNNLEKENNDIKLILNNLQRSSSDEKDYLWRRIETIKADIMAKAKDINQDLKNEEHEPERARNQIRDLKNMLDDSRFNHNQTLDELNKLKSENQDLMHDNQTLKNKVNIIEKELNDVKIDLIAEEGYKSKLETQLKGLSIEFRSQKNIIEALKQDAIAGEEKCSQLIKDNHLLEGNTRTLKERLEASNKNVKQAKGNLEINVKKIKQLEKEKLKLEEELASRESDLNNLKKNLNLSLSEESMIGQLRFEKKELGKVVTSLSNELKLLQVRFEQEKCIWSDTQQNLLSKLETATQKEGKLRIEYESMLQQIEEVRKQKLILEENYSQAKMESVKINSQISNMKERDKKDESQVASSFTQTDLPGDLTLSFDESWRQVIEEKDRIIESNRSLILQLEHQKGFVVDREMASLKEKISLLENELLGLRTKLKNSEEKYKKELESAVSKCQALQNDLKKERLVMKDLRHSIFIEKRDLYQLKREVAFLKTRLSQSNYVAEKRKQELISLNQSIQKMQVTDKQLKSENETLKNELYKSRLNYESLSKSIEDDQEKKNSLALELNNLMLSIQERDKIIEGLRSEIEGHYQRHSSLEQTIRDQNDMFGKEIENLKSELVQTCEEKFYFQNQVSELKMNLNQSLEKNQKLISVIEQNQISLSHSFFDDLTSHNSNDQK